MAKRVSAEALKAAAEYVRKREVVRVEVVGDSVLLWICGVLVNVYSDVQTEAVEALADQIRAGLQKEFEARARWIAKESRYREVRHY